MHEILGDAACPLGPGFLRLSLEAPEQRDRLADGRGQVQRRKRAGRDLLVDRHEPIDRAQAQDPDARKDDDHESRSQKHF